MRLVLIAITGFLTLPVADLLGWQGLPALVRTAGAETPVSQTGPGGSGTGPASLAKEEARSESVRVLLIPEQETTLSSTVAARIKALHVSLGSSFAAGQALIHFDCEEQMARLNMAKAELAGAVETHEAKVRMQGLNQASDVEVALAASAVEKARAQTMLYQVQVKECSVKAPWAGRVSKVHVRTHMGVTPGQPMVDLVKNGPLKLKLNVPSRALGHIKMGQLFNITIDETGKTYQARVAVINSRVDPVSQTIEVEASMTRIYPELLAGMSGIANLANLTGAH
jgi:RND family efflux transporter MFP subunit